ncbi:hypothetical protein SAMN06296378_2426 [Salinibacterium xinjiangense]|uniref:Uncharacterized protein n=1 Tax=Salinibacterium xinjiangense TaxID=386302 RepID=A0A2C9A0A6_9MICO|nr:hypothetical protein SAMN06296378_2426 [Salinibacterium xinjiangense]
MCYQIRATAPRTRGAMLPTSNAAAVGIRSAMGKVDAPATNPIRAGPISPRRSQLRLPRTVFARLRKALQLC